MAQFQVRALVLIVSMVLSVSVSLVSITQHASANQNVQTSARNTGYGDGYKAAECDFERCHGHGYDAAIPSGHTSSYDNGYSKGYQDGWNKVSGSTGSTVVANSSTGSSSSKQSTHNTTAATTTKNATEPKSEQIPNNSQGCDPTHQFCAMNQ